MARHGDEWKLVESHNFPYGFALAKDFIECLLILGEWRPGKAGITFTKKEWSQLLALQPEINFDA